MSPPGGDFADPVTSATLGIVQASIMGIQLLQEMPIFCGKFEMLTLQMISVRLLSGRDVITKYCHVSERSRKSKNCIQFSSVMGIREYNENLEKCKGML